METKEKFKLIEGIFTSKEAKNMLHDLISSKIKFHTKEAISIMVRTNGDNSHSLNRVAELKETRKKIEQLIELANENDLKLEIKGDIEISFINK